MHTRTHTPQRNLHLGSPRWWIKPPPFERLPSLIGCSVKHKRVYKWFQTLDIGFCVHTRLHYTSSLHSFSYHIQLAQLYWLFDTKGIYRNPCFLFFTTTTSCSLVRLYLSIIIFVSLIILETRLRLNRLFCWECALFPAMQESDCTI